MGQNITLKCTSCNNSILLTVGQGINDNHLDRVLEYFSDSNKTIIRNELNNLSNENAWMFIRMIATCKVNHNIVSLPTFHIMDGMDRIAAEQCDCGGEHIVYNLEQLEKGEFQIKCPKCGQNMRLIRNGFWD